MKIHHRIVGALGLAIFLALATPTAKVPVARAATISCPNDPDDATAGSYTLDTRFQQECQNVPVYDYDGTTAKPTIHYFVRSSSGSTKSMGPHDTALVMTGTPAFGQFVFRGTTTYGKSLTIVVNPASYAKGVRTNQSGNKTAITVNDPTGAVIPDSQLSGATDSSSTDVKPAAKCGVLPVKCDGSSINKGGNGIFDLINWAVNWFIKLLGALAIITIIVSGIQYIVSQGSPDLIKGAKERITNAVIGLILLSLMFVILRFLGVAQ